jgi:alkylhydroperoxidase family enzyme
MNGLTDDQILDIRKGNATFDAKLNALLQFTKDVTENKGKASQESKNAFFEAGYSEANVIDVVMLIGDKIISNYINNLTEIAIDFPVATEI